MFNPSCQKAELLFSIREGQVSESESQEHTAGCPLCGPWAAEHQTLVQHVKSKGTTLSAEKLATMRVMFLAAPGPRPAFLTRPRVFGVFALAASLLLLLWVAPLFRSEDAALLLTSGLGPHQGLLQEKNGARVELVIGPTREVQVYLFDAKGVQNRASGEVTMLVSSNDFAANESRLLPVEDGAFLLGKLPEAKGAAEVKLVFPSGAEFVFSGVALGESGSLVVAPPVEVPGGVAVLENARLEAEILARGEVRVRAYGKGAAPLPSSDFSVPELVVEHEKKKYPVKLKPKDGYWVGYVTTPTELKVGAQVVIVCIAPLVIRGVEYEPSRVVFTTYSLKVSIKLVAPVIAPTVIIKYDHPHNGKGSKRSHKHKKGSHK
jgi:hypothetical protein